MSAITADDSYLVIAPSPCYTIQQEHGTMLRKILLVSMAVVLSYGLTAFSGYILYMSSEGRSEAHLSIVVRFIASPLIAVLVGSLVGLLSTNRPILTLIIGLAPWTIMHLSSNKPDHILGWLSWSAPILVYIPLGATASAFAWRYWHEPAKESGLLA